MNSGLYVLQLSDGRVKVGRSVNFNSRISTHAVQFKKQGIEILRQQRFRAEFLTQTDLCRVESAMITSILIFGGVRQKSKEIFSGITFEIACEAACEALLLKPYRAI